MTNNSLLKKITILLLFILSNCLKTNASNTEFLADSSSNKDFIFDVIIDKVLVVNDSVLYKNFNKDTTYRLNHKDNTLVFYFKSPDNDSLDILFKYKLIGFDKKWSNWEKTSFKKYKNLSDERYSFQIKAKNKRRIIKTNEFNFTISEPFYKTTAGFIIYFLFILLLIIMIIKKKNYLFYKEKLHLLNEIENSTKELVQQKEKYETLISEELSKKDALKLKTSFKERSKRYKMVTVLFSNITGFNKLAEQKNSKKLIDDLDKLYIKFDEIVKSHNVEKIKTAGDTYLCAGGIPEKNKTNPIEVILAAFEMQEYIQKIKNKYANKNEPIWDIKIGIHTGPVFADIRQNKKRSIDIWGDTVTIASRINSSGEFNKINISANTYELIKDYFICKYFGKMPIKYEGDINMFYIESFRNQLSEDKECLKANNKFYTKLGHLRFDDLENYMLNKIEEKLSKSLFYHNLKHTIDVSVQVEIIGKKEGVTEEEMLLLKTAALFHDSGFIKSYTDHELIGIQIAGEILPKYGYSHKQIEVIGDLIFATKLPPKPKNKLEQIICDADLDYLGRVDYIPVSNNLFKELVAHKIIPNDINEWNKTQIKFIEKHQYFTKTAKTLREVNKKLRLEEIRKLVNY
ncbi:MAG: guanylate cyclase [Bacteroidetes bacterium]|nr:guanylate cyclase [Bacteroidota bacterium]